MATPRRSIWMDSGAFSAFGKGETLHLPSYCAWLKQHAQYIDYFAVLDDMGSAEKTLQNQLAMEGHGLKPVPCFHFGEDIRYLTRYLDAGHPYIAIGGMVGKSRVLLADWLDGLWTNYLTDADGFPRLKVHGFGITSFEIVDRYPWFSVDSSSWLFGSKAGTALFHVAGRMQRVGMDAEATTAANPDGHYLTFARAAQAELRQRIVALGFTEDQLLNEYWSRNCFNALAMMKMAREWTLRPWNAQQTSLLGEGPDRVLPRGLRWDSLSLFLAAEVGLREEAFMLKHNMPRMFSYYQQKDRPNRTWRYAMAAIDGSPLPEITGT